MVDFGFWILDFGLEEGGLAPRFFLTSEIPNHKSATGVFSGILDCCMIRRTSE